jgi:hypothetical protein
MTPEFLPLLDRGLRRRRRETLARARFDAATDFTLATPYEPGAHTVRVPALPDEVRRHLVAVEYDRHETTGRLAPRRVPLFLPQGECDVVPWGLVPLLAQAARQRLPVRVEANAPPVPLRSDGSDPLVSAMLHSQQRMVVRHAREVRPARLIAAFARARPKRRIAVFVARRRDGGHLVAELRLNDVDAFGFFGGARVPSDLPHVAVGTAAGLSEAAAWHAGCSVCVALDAASFVGAGGLSARYESAWVDVPWLGLVSADRTLSPLEHARLVCFFGPARLDLPAHGVVRRRVTYAGQRIHLPGGGGADRVVAALAGALADRGRADPTAAPFPVVRAAAAIPGPVAVLAQDRRHQSRLRRHLRAADRYRVAVVTPAELSGLTHLGVLVRADRRSGCPPLPPPLRVESQTDRSPLLGVDAHGPADAGLLRDRVTAYRAAGWIGLAAHIGGYAEWESWTHRPLPGRASGRRSGPR